MSSTPVATLLAEAREHITRVEAGELRARIADGALTVDIRPDFQRRDEGELGFGITVERNVLEWRFDLNGPDCLPHIGGYDRQVIVVCSEGYASSLAAACFGGSAMSTPRISSAGIGPGKPGGSEPNRCC
jgi:hypothetical protein